MRRQFPTGCRCSFRPCTLGVMRAATPRGLRYRSPGFRRGRTVLGGCAVALLGHVSAAPAQEKEPSRKVTTACLAWKAETSCQSAAETERAVEEMLGRRIFQGPSCDLQIEASLRKAGVHGWEARLSFARENGIQLGVRTLRSPEAACKALKNPVSLVVALMAEDSESNSTLYVPEGPRPSQPTNHSLRISASVAGSQGLLPNGALGNSLGADVDLTAWLSGRMDTTFWFPRSSTSAGPGGEFWAWHAGVAACPSLGRQPRLQASACLGFQMGVLRGSGIALPYRQSASKVYADADARAILSVPLGQTLALLVFVGAAVPWLRPGFVYLNASGSPVDVHRPCTIVFLAGLGIASSVLSTTDVEVAQP